MDLKKSLLIGVLLSIIGLGSWELYWRTQTDYYIAYLEDDRNLWAEQRAKVESATADDIILLGASRTGYNFNTKVWQEVQGIKPINLTGNGKSPTPFLRDIVNHTDFNGTIVMGIIPIVVFQDFGEVAASEWVNYYYKRTYAQRLGFILSKPLKRHLVMLSASEAKSYNDLDLKSLLHTITIDDGRVDAFNFNLVNIGYNDEDRNLIMFPRLTNHPVYQKEITDQWDKALPPLPDYSDEVAEIISSKIASLDTLVRKFKARGGKIIFIRHKAEAPWLKHAFRVMSRENSYDQFIQTVDCPAYHFQDYEFMSKYYLPDWSHMNAEDAKIYTTDMVNKLIEDGHLKKRQPPKKQ